MSAELRITESHWEQLRGHLLIDGDEHAALLICGTVASREGPVLVTRRVLELEGDPADLRLYLPHPL